MKLLINTLILFTVIFSITCSKKKDFQFCFSSIVEGDIAVDPVIIGSEYVPCGFLGCVYSTTEPKIDNKGIKFDSMSDLCGKTASGYTMEIPDSAYIEWGDDGKIYKKKLALPPFPKLHPGEKYRVGFCIGYQDCVYVRVETIPKY